jgi:8-oxo-dGTP diphosphatase
MVHEVVAALIVQRQKILLGLRAAERKYIPNVWDMFGGHLEPGEKHHQTLFRELEEELGITPTEWRHLETLTLSYPGTVNEPSDEWTTHIYLVTAWSGTPTNRQPDEHSDIGWFSLKEATQLELADPIYPTVFARYLDRE